MLKIKFMVLKFAPEKCEEKYLQTFHPRRKYMALWRAEVCKQFNDD